MAIQYLNDLEKFLEEPEEESFVRSEEELDQLLTAKRYFVTSAQNNTPLNPEAWNAVQTWRRHWNAQLLVIPIRYKNPTSRDEADNDEWWPEAIRPYIVENELVLHQHLRVMGHVKIAATAVNPLTGLEPLSHGSSAIFGHGQVQMRTIPTPQNELSKILHTTGSISIKNYSHTKAGVKGAFHHVLGGLVVECDDEVFHLRSVLLDKNGGFYDINRYYDGSGVGDPIRVAGLVTGDEHTMFMSSEVKAATYLREDSIAKTCRPEKIVRHDLNDSYTVSHWHRHNVVTRYVKHHYGVGDLRQEMDLAWKMLEATTPEDTENIIVSSNHNDHILRWLNETDPRSDLQNLTLWCELMPQVVKAATFGSAGVSHPDPLQLYLEPKLQCPTRFLERDESCMIAGVEISLHGDQGSNGSRGSAGQMSKIGVRTIIGHSHTPCIEKGCYQVGTSTALRLEYTRGPSSWFNTHCLVFPNGKRQLINVIDGRWRMDPELAA